MAINRFNQPIQAEYISQYAPMPFQELVALGKYYGEQRKAAEEQLNTKLQTFGKFRSPSEIDTKRYYEESIGKFAPLIEQAVANPDLMKSSAFRAQLQNAYNTVNYANLSMLEESAANQRAGLEMRAKMKAEGKYKDSWDLSDIASYDTLRQKRVFTDITPVQYMNFNEMSNKYFDNLKAGDLGYEWRDGVRYRKIGNNEEDLMRVYDTFRNDLIDSPQGQMHLRDFKMSGMTDEQAENAFRKMIIGSQMDRVVRPQLVVDQGYYTALKANHTNQPNVVERKPTRHENMSYDISKKMIGQFVHLPESTRKELEVFDLSMQGFKDEYDSAKKAYNENPSNENLIRMNNAKYHFDQTQQQARDFGMFQIMSKAFEDAAKFKLGKQANKSKNYSREGYLAGVNNALGAISDDSSLHPISDGGDPILTRLGGEPVKKTQTNGTESYVYKFNDSFGFLLPESAFQLGTKTQNESIKRNAGWFRDDSFPLREAIEGGYLRDVEFIPNNKESVFQYSTEYINDYGEPSLTGQKYVRGKLRIPAEQVEQMFGTGTWSSAAANIVLPFGRGTTSGTLRTQYNAKEIKYGADGQTYYEIDIVRQLPKDSDGDYWKDIDSLRENTTSSGGVGGASQASDMQPDIERAAMQYNLP